MRKSPLLKWAFSFAALLLFYLISLDYPANDPDFITFAMNHLRKILPDYLLTEEKAAPT